VWLRVCIHMNEESLRDQRLTRFPPVLDSGAPNPTPAMASSHVGLDIRDMMRSVKDLQGTMKGDALSRNTAPTFGGSAKSFAMKPLSRPQRPSDISFEAEMEREVQARAAHGRRAASRDTYGRSLSAPPAEPPAPAAFSAAAGGGAAPGPPPPRVTNTRTPGTFAAAFAHKKDEAQPSSSAMAVTKSEIRRERSGASSRGVGSLLSRSLDLGAPSAPGQSRPELHRQPGSVGAISVNLGAQGFGELSIGSMAVNYSSNGRQLDGSLVPKARAISAAAPTAPAAGGQGASTSLQPSGSRLPAAGRPQLSIEDLPTPLAPPPVPSAALPVPPPPVGSPVRDGGASGSGTPSPSKGGAGGGGGGGAGGGAGGAATRVVRAKEWSVEVENAYRLQEAGYRDEHEALSLGHPPLEYWPTEPPLVRKLVTRETVGKEAQSQIYFGKKRECDEKNLNKVKLYAYD
jgi:hypothetical protein